MKQIKSPSTATRLTGIALLHLVLNGCAVGPDYQAPDTVVPENFVQGLQKDYSNRPVDSAWWRLFDDTQLTALIDTTLQHNYDLQSAQANLLEARALYLQAGLELLPNIGSHASYTDQKRSFGALNNRTYAPRELKLYNIGFDATWEFDIFGRKRRKFEASNDEVEAQEASLRDLSISLTAEVARNYFELRGLQNQLNVAQKNVDIQRETLAITEARVENGRGTDLDNARALAQLENTRAALPPLQSAIQRALHRLSVLTGQLPGALDRSLSPDAAMPKLPETINIGTPAEFMRRRPDIRIAERSLAASTARIGVATADLFPRVTFVGSISLEASTFSGLGMAGADTYSLGPKITWPALSLGTVFARIKAADAHAEADLARYQQTVLNALEETENALVNYNRERVRQQLLSSAAQASQKAHQIARLHYNAGITDFLTVLDAEARLLQDQAGLAQSETAVATALTALYKSLGGGWQ